MSVRVMTAVFDHSKSRLADRLVLLVIADRSDDDGSGCWRGKESIARMAGVSRTTVTEALRRLEQAGELAIDHRVGRTNEYRVTLPGVGQNPAGSPNGVGQDSAAHPATRPAAHPATRPAATRPPVRPRSIPEPSSDPPAANAAPSPRRKTDPRAQVVTNAWWLEQNPRPLQKFIAVVKLVDTAIKAGHSEEAVLAALRKIGNDPPVVLWKLEKALAVARPRRDPRGLNHDRIGG